MHSRLETALSIIFTSSAVVFASTFAIRTFSDRDAAARSSGVRPPEFLTDWERLRTQAVRVGPASAKVAILEFGDFECPVCKEFHSELQVVRQKFPNDVAVLYAHFPLSRHRFATAAARASECADRQGKFEQIHDLLFAKQDSLGLKEWVAYATEAGVGDTAAFNECLSTGAFPRIDAGLAAAKAIEARGTPTVIVNGWRLFHTPSASELVKMVQAVLQNRSPATVVSAAR
ncbi:MAG: thioredoxin domain-containing protein [Gemmatimonadota bacterium]